MRNPYEYPEPWEAGGEPDEDTEREPESWTCRGCGETMLRCDDFKFFNGWPWCSTHYRLMVNLSMDPDQRELEGQERAARQDIERDDFNRVRR